jgi:serine/threonine protein kinase
MLATASQLFSFTSKSSDAAYHTHRLLSITFAIPRAIIMSSSVEPNLKADYIRDKKVGKGADGSIELWKHRWIVGKTLVVKYLTDPADTHNPEDDKTRPERLKGRKRNLGIELEAMKLFQGSKKRTEHIVEFLGYEEHWTPHGPALFYEYCPLGNLFTFHKLLVASILYDPVPEETTWKFFLNIVKGLRFLSHTSISNRARRHETI